MNKPCINVSIEMYNFLHDTKKKLNYSSVNRVLEEYFFSGKPLVVKPQELEKDCDHLYSVPAKLYSGPRLPAMCVKCGEKE